MAAVAYRRTELEPSAVSLLTITPRPRRRARGRGTVMAGRRHAVRALLERGVEGDGSIRPASSTSGRANVRGIRTLRSSRGPVRSSSRASIAPTATGRRARTATPPSTRGPPGSTSVPTRVTRPCWTATTPPSGRRSSSGASRSGSRWRTPFEHSFLRATGHAWRSRPSETSQSRCALMGSTA